jgi:hypothetical protein
MSACELTEYGVSMARFAISFLIIMLALWVGVSAGRKFFG